MTREDILRSLFDTSGFGLEVGASYNPLLPKAAGYNVQTFDHADQSSLIEKYRAQGENTDRIEPVDFVGDGRPMHEIIGQSGIYDFIFASHVIEHTTDLVRFLQDCETLLKADGRLVLAVPDRRFCFDFFRPLSSTGQIIEAWLDKRTRHSPATVFDNLSLYAKRGGEIAWQRTQHGPFALERHPTAALVMTQERLADGRYHDMHGWTFSPSSFRYHVKVLNELGLIGLNIADLRLTNGFEFYAVLTCSAPASARSSEELMLDVAAEQADAELPGRATGRGIVAVIPLYNGERFIADALHSIQSQTRPPREIVVVDDGSTDGGAAIVEGMARTDPRIRLIRKTNGGQSSARNLGVASSSSELIALLDQDDIWYPEHLERLARPFDDNTMRRPGWVYSDLDEGDTSGHLVTRGYLSKDIDLHPKVSIHQCISRDMFVVPSTTLISRSAFKAVGGFDERLTGYEDDDFFLRLFRAGFDNIYIPEALSIWRIHTGSASYSLGMTTSRTVYMRKLIRMYPNEPRRSRFWRRDLIAPRFAHGHLGSLFQAAEHGRVDVFRAAADGLVELRRYLNPKRRFGLALAMPLIGNYRLMRVAYRLRMLRIVKRRIARALTL